MYAGKLCRLIKLRIKALLPAVWVGGQSSESAVQRGLAQSGCCGVVRSASEALCHYDRCFAPGHQIG